MNFQVPIQYGALHARRSSIEPGFDIVWPIAGLADMQGGMGRVRMPLGVAESLHRRPPAPTSSAAIALPADLRGDLLFAEPVGRLIRRAKIVKTEGLTQLRNAYPGSEFILSTDPLFRPVNMQTAPDGTVYIADMYHGIIQEAQWTPPGSYLRQKIEQYQLDKVIDSRPHLAAALRRRARQCRPRPHGRPRARRRAAGVPAHRARLRRSRGCWTRRRRSSSRISRIRTAGGATPRSGCSC